MPNPRALPRYIPITRDIPWWPEWTRHGECLKYDPEIFFDIGVSGRNPEKIKRAKAVCAKCPVIRLCLRDNIAVPYGVFGGMTPGERLKALGILRQKTPYRVGFSNYVRSYTKYAAALKRNPMTGSRSSSELMRRLAHESGVFGDG